LFIFIDPVLSFGWEGVHVYTFNPCEVETIRALREVIFSIVEANIKEEDNILTQNHLVDKVFTSFNKNQIYYSNGIAVDIGDKVNIQLNVTISHNFCLDQIINLQKKIYDDILELTGCEVTEIKVKIKNFI
jgi:uncharacterized alkaline shock family protein YloU